VPLCVLVCILRLIVRRQEKLTLEQAVAEVLRSNPCLQAARWEAEASLIQADREWPVARRIITVTGKVLAQGPEGAFP